VLPLQVHRGHDHVQPGHSGDRQAQRAADQRARLHDGAAVHRELRHHRHHAGLQQRAAAADAALGQPRGAHHHQPVHQLVRPGFYLGTENIGMFFSMICCKRFKTVLYIYFIFLFKCYFLKLQFKYILGLSALTR